MLFFPKTPDEAFSALAKKMLLEHRSFSARKQNALEKHRGQMKRLLEKESEPFLLTSPAPSDQAFSLGCQLLEVGVVKDVSAFQMILRFLAKKSGVGESAEKALFSAGVRAVHSFSFVSFQEMNEAAAAFSDVLVAKNPSFAKAQLSVFLDGSTEPASDRTCRILLPHLLAALKDDLMRDKTGQSREPLLKGGVSMIRRTSFLEKTAFEEGPRLDPSEIEARDYLAKTLFALAQDLPSLRGPLAEDLLTLLPFDTFCSFCTPVAGRKNPGLGPLSSQTWAAFRNARSLTKELGRKRMRFLSGLQGMLPEGEVFAVSKGEADVLERGFAFLAAWSSQHGQRLHLATSDGKVTTVDSSLFRNDDPTAASDLLFLERASNLTANRSGLKPIVPQILKRLDALAGVAL